MTNDDNSDDNDGGSRVGYQRPPKEYQFQKGQKPPPRRGKRIPVEADVTTRFWEVLQEKRRVIINGKPIWATGSELLVRCAYIAAEKGSPSVQRLLNQMLLEKTGSADDMPEIEICRDPPS